MGDARTDWVFGVLERAAVEGRRCPTNPEIAECLQKSGLRAAAGSIPGVLRTLVREGRIIVRVYGGNWRDVVIAAGPHAGKSTKGPPHGGKPYSVIDAVERTKRDSEPTWTRSTRRR